MRERAGVNFEGRPGLRRGPLGNWVVPVSRHKSSYILAWEDTFGDGG